MKAGVGVSSVAAMLALGQAERAKPTLLVDLLGDQPAVFGLQEPSLEAPGLGEWWTSTTREAQSLARICLPVTNDLELVPRGTGQLGGNSAELTTSLAQDLRSVVVDCGALRDPFRTTVAATATTGLMVVRACYLTLRAALQSPVEPTGLVLLSERGRALRTSDVEAAVGVGVVAEVAVDPVISRSIDAGLAHCRLPRSLIRTMTKVLPDVA